MITFTIILTVLVVCAAVILGCILAAGGVLVVPIVVLGDVLLGCLPFVGIILFVGWLFKKK